MDATCSRCGHPLDARDAVCDSCGFNQRIATAETGAIDIEAVTTGIQSSDLPGDVCTLTVMNGPAAGERYLLIGEPESSVTVGRAADTDIFLDDVTVSRHHGTFTRINSDPSSAPAVWRYDDNGSLNGTYINGARTEGSILADRDTLIIGKFKFSYRSVTGE